MVYKILFLYFTLYGVVSNLTSCYNHQTTTSQEVLPLYLKKIQTPNFTIKWYYKSLISNTTPDFVVFEVGGIDSIICKAHNIKDVVLFGSDSLQIVFCDTPKLYGEKITIPSSVKNVNVSCNILQNCDLKPVFRRTFYK